MYYYGGMVYTMTNASDSNEVVAFHRLINGMLANGQVYATGGSGTGEAVVDPLGSQGSLVISPNRRFLFAVNAGSNSISSFSINYYGDLVLVDVEPSGGVKPNSIAVYNNILYVSNAGNASNSFVSNITGFIIDNNGFLSPIPGATYSLSTADATPACIIFSKDGTQLFVSELSTNRISVFNVNANGTLNGPIVNISNGAGPFGSVALTSGIILVAEAGANALTSYDPLPNGTLNVISGSIPNGQSATCWVSTSRFERLAFTSNTGSGTISTYRINPGGSLSLNSIVYSIQGGLAAPIDNAVSRDGRDLYVLNGDQGTISVFCIDFYGQLILMQVASNSEIPTIGAQGLAVY